MSGEMWQVFTVFGFFIVMLMITGSYCILVTRNLIRTIIGLEILMKAVTLFLVVVGYVTGNTALMQSFVITIIVVEVVLAATAGGIALRVFRSNNDLNANRLSRLKG